MAQTEKQTTRPGTELWLAICLVAACLGFYLGQRQQAVIEGQSKSNVSQSGSVTLTDHTISDIAKAADRWVVTVETETKHPELESDHVVPGMGEIRSSSSGGGAGMVFRADGYVVTCNHVLGLDRNIEVVLPDHRHLPAKVVGRDWFSDVAVLKVDAGDLPHTEFSKDTVVEPGEWAVAIGSPMRLDHSISLGIVSAVGRTISDTSVPGTDLIQTDAAINPGNSGGPLLNIHGQVIGMNTAIQRTAQNISFAVPADIIDEVCTSLINNGKIARGYLGVFTGNAHQEPVLPDERREGVFVVSAVEHSPAAKAGLVPGDIIQTINDKPVRTNTDVRRMIRPLKPGDRILMSIMHQGNIKKISLALGEAPEPTASPKDRSKLDRSKLDPSQPDQLPPDRP